jgi:hypothetical protein
MSHELKLTAMLFEVQRAAKLMLSEAQTWREGFSVEIDGRLKWDRTCDFAQIRYIKLTNCANNLIKLSAKLIPP